MCTNGVRLWKHQYSATYCWIVSETETPRSIYPSGNEFTSYNIRQRLSTEAYGNSRSGFKDGQQSKQPAVGSTDWSKTKASAGFFTKIILQSTATVSSRGWIIINSSHTWIDRINSRRMYGLCVHFILLTYFHLLPPRQNPITELVFLLSCISG